MNIKSKDLYRRLRERLAPVLKSRNYQRTKDSVLGWYKPLNDQYFLFWFQCDKWGWDDDWGSNFTIEFQVSDVAKAAYGNMQYRQRAFFLLSENALQEMRERNNEIISQMPGFKLKKQTYVEEGDEKILMLGKDLSLKSYGMNIDQWFEYFTFDDIDRWAEFFLKNLDDIEKRALLDAA